MESSQSSQRDTATSRSLREVIRQERMREASALDDQAARRSNELARLEVLKASLETVFDEIPESDDRFALALAPSTPARLWIDMFTYVAMDPASQVYRLVRNGRQGHRVLAETRDVTEMAERVMDYIAQQIVARERELEGLAEYERREARPHGKRRGSRVGIAIAAFVIGLLTGMVGLFALGYLLTM